MIRNKVKYLYSKQPGIYPNYSPDFYRDDAICHDFTAGIAEPNQIPYSIFPNPFHTTTTLKINTENAELKIYNTLG